MSLKDDTWLLFIGVADLSAWSDIQMNLCFNHEIAIIKMSSDLSINDESVLAVRKQAPAHSSLIEDTYPSLPCLSHFPL